MAGLSGVGWAVVGPSAGKGHPWASAGRQQTRCSFSGVESHRISGRCHRIEVHRTSGRCHRIEVHRTSGLRDIPNSSVRHPLACPLGASDDRDAGHIGPWNTEGDGRPGEVQYALRPPVGRSWPAGERKKPLRRGQPFVAQTRSEHFEMLRQDERICSGVARGCCGWHFIFCADGLHPGQYAFVVIIHSFVPSL